MRQETLMVYTQFHVYLEGTARSRNHQTSCVANHLSILVGEYRKCMEVFFNCLIHPQFSVILVSSFSVGKCSVSKINFSKKKQWISLYIDRKQKHESPMYLTQDVSKLETFNDVTSKFLKFLNSDKIIKT